MKSERRHYTLFGNSEAIERDLAALREADKQAEGQAAEHGKTKNKGCLISVGSLVAMLLLGLAKPSLHADTRVVVSWIATAMNLGILGGLIVYVVGGARQGHAAKGDIDDTRYMGLQKLHDFLKQDCSEGTEYTYTLDLRGYTDSAFHLRSESFGGWFSYPKGQFKYYCMPVLTARVTLRDGTVLNIGVERNTRVKDYQKKNYRGKVKSKWKAKQADVCTVSLKLPGQLSEQTRTVRPPSLLTRSGSQPRFKAAGNKVQAMAKVESKSSEFSIEPVMQLAAWTFQNLKQKPSAA